MTTKPSIRRSTTYQRSRGSAAAAALAAVVALAGAGCGSSSDDSRGSGAQGDSAQAKAATDKAAAFEKAPSALAQTVPLTAKPTPHTVVWLKCENDACKNIAAGMQAATEALGWTYKEVQYRSDDPASLVTGLRTALQYKPVAVGLSGIPESSWASVEPEYEKAGVKIIPTVTDAKVGPVVPTVIGDFTSSGQGMAQFVIGNSGAAAHTLLVNVPAFSVLTKYVNGAKETFDADCSGCRTTSFEGSFAQLGNGSFVPSIVTALRKDTSIDYVMVAADLLVPTLPSALRAAGLSNVKIVGGQPVASNVQNISSGTELAASEVNNVLVGWSVVDAAARISLGMDTPALDTPFQLITKSNVQSTDVNGYGIPTDYQEQFKTLWQLQ